MSENIEPGAIAGKVLQKNLANILRKLSEGKTLSGRELKLFQEHQAKRADEDLAKQYNCDERTIRNWRKDGAPLNDPAEMRAWLATRKNVPANVTSKGGAAPDVIPLEMTLDAGAAAALRRLAEAEVNAAQNFQKCLKEGDPLTTKNALKAWLETLDALRKYDAQIEASRRDSGELLPRCEVERILRALVWYLRMAGQQTAAVVAEPLCAIKEPWQANKILCRLFWEQFLNAFSALATHSSGEIQVPAWVIQSLCSDLEFVLKDVPETVKERSEAIAELIEHNSKASVEKARRR